MENKSYLEQFIELLQGWYDKGQRSSASRKERNLYHKLINAAEKETGLTVNELRLIAAYRSSSNLKKMIAETWRNFLAELQFYDLDLNKLPD